MSSVFIEYNNRACIGVMGLRVDENEYRIQGFTDIIERVGKRSGWRSSK